MEKKRKGDEWRELMERRMERIDKKRGKKNTDKYGETNREKKTKEKN